MYKKRIFILITLVLLGVAALIILSLNKNHSVSAFRSDVLATNIQYPSIKSGNLRFFTGSNFAQIKVGQPKSVTLFRELKFPAVEDVLWTDGGAVVKLAVGAADYDKTDPEIINQIYASGPYASDHYWFYVDFENSQLSIIKLNKSVRGIKGVVPGDGKLFLLDSSGSIYKQNFDETSAALVTKDPKASSLISYSQPFLFYRDSGGKIKIVNNNQVDQLNSSGQLGDVKYDNSNTNNWFVAYTILGSNLEKDSEANVKKTLYVYDTKKQKNIYKKANFAGNFYIANGQLITLKPDKSSQIVSLNLDSKKTTIYKFKPSAITVDTSVFANFVDDNLVLVSQDKFLTALTTNSGSAILNYSAPLVVFDNYQNKINSGTIFYDINTSSTEISPDGTNVDQKNLKLDTINYFLSKNIDPNQTSKNYVLISPFSNAD